MVNGVQVITATQAFSPGADIWILPRPEVSALARTVDWFLNFQISRGLQNQPRKRSDVLETLLRKVKWALPPSMDTKGSPLLIAATGRLPTRWVLMPDDWNADLEFLRRAAPLNPTRIRLFLPANLSPDLFRATTAGPVLNELRQKFEIEVLAES